jgi:hypothetical protein
MVLTLDEEKKKRKRERERCRTITENILIFLLVVHSMKVNFVELLFTCIKRTKENIKMNAMNDAIKPGSNFLYAKKNGD